MKKVLGLLFVIIFTVSCNDEPVTELGVYTPKNYEIEQTKLFTLSGEIVNKQIIADFINRHDFRHSFIQNLDSIKDLSKLYKLKYKSSTEIILFHGSDSVFFKVKTQNEISYLESVALDTQPIDYYGSVTYPKFLLYKPLHADTIQISENTGISKFVRYIPCHYATITNNKITFTILTYGLYKKTYMAIFWDLT